MDQLKRSNANIIESIEETKREQDEEDGHSALVTEA